MRYTGLLLSLALLIYAIVPINSQVSPAGASTEVLLSIGMSNAAGEWCGIQRGCVQGQGASFMVKAQPLTSLVLVNGAQGSTYPSDWLGSRIYDVVRDQRLAPLGATEANVRHIWWKPNTLITISEMLGELAMFEARYPNLIQVTVQGRTYGGYATNGDRGEPLAYDTWARIDELLLTYSGRLQLTRGPYWWNASDPREWYATDGIHPSALGIDARSSQLLDFFQAQPWFAGAPLGSVTPTNTPTMTSTPSATKTPQPTRTPGPTRTPTARQGGGGGPGRR